MECENYVQFIVNAHRIQYEAKAPERTQRIRQACASYAACQFELLEEIHNINIETNNT